MERHWLEIFRTVFYVMLAWFVISTMGHFHWFFSLVLTVGAFLNVAVVWMLREHRYRLAIACRRQLVRKYVAGVCFFTGDQVPVDLAAHVYRPEVLLRTQQDFSVAAMRARQIVRGHDRVVEKALSRIYENQTLRRSCRIGAEKGPLASFLLVGDEGVGKRYWMRVLSKLLYQNGGVELFDCDLLTPDDLVGSPNNAGQLMEVVRKQPHQLILFEQIEKTSSDTMKVFSQLLTAGKLHQPGSNKFVSFQEATIAFTTTQAAADLAKLTREQTGDVGWQHRATALIGDETQIDHVLLNGVTDVCFFESPSDLVKAEVVALLMKKECLAHRIELSHVDPEILATQVLRVDEEFGFCLVPQRVRTLLRKPLVLAAPQQAESLALRIHGSGTSIAQKRN